MECGARQALNCGDGQDSAPAVCLLHGCLSILVIGAGVDSAGGHLRGAPTTG